MSKNNTAWKKIFDKYDILQKIKKNGSFNISAAQIKEFREPRLMVKFDHSVNLPQIFMENKLAILPVTRGDYVISRFDLYHKFEDINSTIINLSLPDYLQSLSISNIQNEAIALNCAFVSGIIDDFMEDEDIFPTVSGRMSSGTFLFNVDDHNANTRHKVQVENSQIEIDAAFEGINSFALFEAKMDISEDFLVRQLYYPFRVWKNRISKPVRPVFLIYSNGIFRLFEYEFKDIYNYNSLQLVKQKNYSIEDTEISITDIQSILENTVIIQEPEIPFPQADKFEKIINLCELANIKDLTNQDIAAEYDIVPRQISYYTNAPRYLGLFDKKTSDGEVLYSISEQGRKILNLSFKQRQLEFCRLILSHKIFNDILQLYLQKGVMPSNDEIIDIMKISNLYHVEGQETFIRRASTIRSWINWIISLIN